MFGLTTLLAAWTILALSKFWEGSGRKSPAAAADSNRPRGRRGRVCLVASRNAARRSGILQRVPRYREARRRFQLAHEFADDATGAGGICSVFRGAVRDPPLVVEPEANRRAQQRRFDDFRRVYNEERPHEAIANATPAMIYRPSPRPYPARVPEMVYPDHWQVRKVHQSGEIRWRGQSIFISEVLTGEPVGVG